MNIIVVIKKPTTGPWRSPLGIGSPHIQFLQDGLREIAGGCYTVKDWYDPTIEITFDDPLSSIRKLLKYLSKNNFLKQDVDFIASPVEKKKLNAQKKLYFS